MIPTPWPPLQACKAIVPTPVLIDFALQITIKEGQVRGDEELQEGFIMLASADDRVPAQHPLRAIRKMVDEALSEMSPLLSSLYCERGRASIPPEYLLRAQLLQILYAIPPERRLCEHIEYNFLFRWFVGLTLTESM